MNSSQIRFLSPDAVIVARAPQTEDAFMARVAMAATLAASYGIYGPAYELLEHRAVREGAEDVRLREVRAPVVGARARRFAGRLHRGAERTQRDNPALQADAGAALPRHRQRRLPSPTPRRRRTCRTSSSASSTWIRTTRKAAGSRSTPAPSASSRSRPTRCTT